MRQKGRKPVFLYFLRAQFCNRYRNYRTTKAETDTVQYDYLTVQYNYLYNVLYAM